MFLRRGLEDFDASSFVLAKSFSLRKGTRRCLTTYGASLLNEVGGVSISCIQLGYYQPYGQGSKSVMHADWLKMFERNKLASNS